MKTNHKWIPEEFCYMIELYPENLTCTRDKWPSAMTYKQDEIANKMNKRFNPEILFTANKIRHAMWTIYCLHNNQHWDTSNTKGQKMSPKALEGYLMYSKKKFDKLIELAYENK